MTLKQFEKVNTEVKTEYIVLRNGDYSDSFEVDFLADTDKLSGMLCQLRKLENNKSAKVKHVTVNSCTHVLTVTVDTN